MPSAVRTMSAVKRRGRSGGSSARKTESEAVSIAAEKDIGVAAETAVVITTIIDIGIMIATELGEIGLETDRTLRDQR